VYTCIYETKGLSLEQVDELYAKVPRAWQSVGWEPSVHYTDVRDVAGGVKGGNNLTQLETEANEKRSGEHATHLESIAGKMDA
jgi:hypothetical protein